MFFELQAETTSSIDIPSAVCCRLGTEFNFFFLALLASIFWPSFVFLDYNYDCSVSIHD